MPNTDDKELAINKKLDELIELLAETNIDSEKAKGLQAKVNKAIEKSSTSNVGIEAFANLDVDNTSRADLLDEFSILLSSHQIDSNVSKSYIRTEKSANWVLMAISIVLITLGFAMIVMPAPPSFEIFTVFYFTQNDGVTVMDLVSLLVVLCGVYLLIKSFHKFPINKRTND
ncbi:hypothetical protein GCM10023149_12820 [Mucilaginibacter gynuensis]|uniref:Uncharacterized protein n=1 Tax=Mucilaginibacter gynuensis TaxID=1302236 RepID=A0ABP8G2F5_9SPHI